MTNNTNSVSGPSLPPESETASNINPPALEAVSQLIAASNRVISDAHVHGRRRVSSTDWMLARFHFAVARRLARLAWKFAVKGKGRLT